MRTTSDQGIALIKQHEGLRLEAYLDPVGIWTIGYGHTTAAGEPKVTQFMKITEAGATAILRSDLAKFERAVTSLVHVPLTQGQFDALVSFTFNVGPGNLSKSTLLRKLNRGDYQGAADQFSVWNKGRVRGQLVVLPGLAKRRAAERALFLSGNEPPVAKPTPEPEWTAPAPPTATPAQTAAPKLGAGLIIALAAALFAYIKMKG